VLRFSSFDMKKRNAHLSYCHRSHCHHRFVAYGVSLARQGIHQLVDLADWTLIGAARAAPAHANLNSSPFPCTFMTASKMSFLTSILPELDENTVLSSWGLTAQ
jgi:hypothetical protein